MPFVWSRSLIDILVKHQSDTDGGYAEAREVSESVVALPAEERRKAAALLADMVGQLGSNADMALTALAQSMLPESFLALSTLYHSRADWPLAWRCRLVLALLELDPAFDADEGLTCASKALEGGEEGLGLAVLGRLYPMNLERAAKVSGAFYAKALVSGNSAQQLRGTIGSQLLGLARHGAVGVATLLKATELYSPHAARELRRLFDEYLSGPVGKSNFGAQSEELRWGLR